MLKLRAKLRATQRGKLRSKLRNYELSRLKSISTFHSAAYREHGHPHSYENRNIEIAMIDSDAEFLHIPSNC